MSRIFEVLDFDSDDTNFTIDFKKLTKKYGRDYIELLHILYQCNENLLTDEEFCNMNGNIPLGFFNNKIKK